MNNETNQCDFPRAAGWTLLLLAFLTPAASATEFHVSVAGDAKNDGSSSKPFKTISAAARVAQPGDVITVHEGTYRERVTPPRGGESDARRIVYQAAAGEKVVIKGSEVIRDWKPFLPGVWKATLPNSFFGSYNPYKDLIVGDWFTDKGRPHHTGEVYLNGKSLWETHLLERVLQSAAGCRTPGTARVPPTPGSPRATTRTPTSTPTSTTRIPTRNWWRSTCATVASTPTSRAATTSRSAASA